jgi:F-type H+-transporting ATPase subunit gamma
MSDDSAALRRRMGRAAQLQSVVRTMKALAAAHIVPYERSVKALTGYQRTVELGLCACLRQGQVEAAVPSGGAVRPGPVRAIVFGSDQGLVGAFNEGVAERALQALARLPGPAQVWAIGERVQGRLVAAGLPLRGCFALPTSVPSITPLVSQLLLAAVPDVALDRGHPSAGELHLFYNRAAPGAAHAPVGRRMLPLDAAWVRARAEAPWPTARRPQVLGPPLATLGALIREHLFASLFQACAESLASENASRLAAMERADRNIDDSLASLHKAFDRLRQSRIDEELFDVVAGFEALSGTGAGPPVTPG